MREPRTTDISVLGEVGGGKGAARTRFLGAIVSAASVLPPGTRECSPLRCRRRPEGSRCAGRIELGRDPPGDVIRWRCTACDDHGLITNWRHTRWDLGPELVTGQVVSISSARARRESQGQAYELLAELIDGPLQIDGAVVRRVRIGGCKTLCDLHTLLAAAYDADPVSSHEFLFGAMYEAGAQRYLSADDPLPSFPAECSTVGCRIESLGLRPGQVFGYVRDLELPWTHRLTVVSAFRGHPEPQVLERVGQPPAMDSERQEPGLFDDIGELAFDPLQEGPFPEAAQATRDERPVDASLFDCTCSAFAGDGPLDPQLWSAMEEVERLLLVLEKHVQTLPGDHPPIGSSLLHALVHDRAEQALTEDAGARHDLRCLMRRGMSRHAAIHVVGQRLVAAQLAVES